MKKGILLPTQDKVEFQEPIDIDKRFARIELKLESLIWLTLVGFIILAIKLSP